MASIALRCAGCRAALRVREQARHLTCCECGAGLEVVREGGAAFTVLDRDLETSADAAAAEGSFRSLSRRPGRGASLLAGATTAIAGAGWAALSVSAGWWWWVVLGALVALVGAASALRAAASPAEE